MTDQLTLITLDTIYKTLQTELPTLEIQVMSSLNQTDIILINEPLYLTLSIHKNRILSYKNHEISGFFPQIPPSKDIKKVILEQLSHRESIPNKNTKPRLYLVTQGKDNDISSTITNLSEAPTNNPIHNPLTGNTTTIVSANSHTHSLIKGASILLPNKRKRKDQ